MSRLTVTTTLEPAPYACSAAHIGSGWHAVGEFLRSQKARYPDFFADPRTLALGLCVDGFMINPHDAGTRSVTAFVFQLFSLPPEARLRVSKQIYLYY